MAQKTTISMAELLAGEIGLGEALLDNLMKTARVLVNDQAVKGFDNVIRAPFPAQARAVRGVQAVWEQVARTALLNADTGTGKSIMGILAAQGIGPDANVVVSCPPNLQYKWGREVKSTLPGGFTVINCRNVGPDDEVVCHQCGHEFLNHKGKPAKGRMVADGTPCTECGDTLRKTALGQLRSELEKPKSGIRFLIVADTTSRMHYHTAKPDLVVSSGRPHRSVKDRIKALKKKKTEEADRLIRLLKTHEDVADSGDFQPAINAILDDKAAQEVDMEMKNGDRLARCPKCGGLSQVKVNADTFRFLTVAQAARKRQLRCTHEVHGLVCGEIWKNPVRSRGDAMGDLNLDEMTEDQVEKILSSPHVMARRVSPAYWAKKHARRQGLIDLLIVDEAHRAKADGIHGLTTRWLANAAKKVLLLTGTLTGGYAHDLFYLQFISSPELMRKAGYNFNSCETFAHMYGGIEIRSWVNKKGKQEKVTKRLPGISQNVYPEFLADRTVFVALDEVNANMPAKKEYLETIRMTPNMTSHYNHLVTTFKSELHQIVKAAGRTATVKLVSTAIQVWSSWPDRLKADTINGKIVDKMGRTIKVNLPVFDFNMTGPTPKEERMIEIIHQNKKEGRKVLIYAAYTGSRDCSRRMEKQFQAAGLKVAVLRKVPSHMREEWILDQVAQGIDVMIVNPEKVKEGLDLLMFPTIISAQPLVNLYTHRQAFARAYRLGQDKEVRHYYLAYEETMQEQTLCRLGERLATAEEAEGKLTDSAMKEVASVSILAEMVNAVLDGNDHLLKLPKIVVTNDVSPLAGMVLAPVFTPVRLLVKCANSKKDAVSRDAGQLALFEFFCPEMEQLDLEVRDAA